MVILKKKYIYIYATTRDGCSYRHHHAKCGFWRRVVMWWDTNVSPWGRRQYGPPKQHGITTHHHHVIIIVFVVVFSNNSNNLNIKTFSSVSSHQKLHHSRFSWRWNSISSGLCCRLPQHYTASHSRRNRIFCAVKTSNLASISVVDFQNKNKLPYIFSDLFLKYITTN